MTTKTIGPHPNSADYARFYASCQISQLFDLKYAPLVEAALANTSYLGDHGTQTIMRSSVYSLHRR